MGPPGVVGDGGPLALDYCIHYILSYGASSVFVPRISEAGPHGGDAAEGTKECGICRNLQIEIDKAMHQDSGDAQQRGQ
jgi:hypothetical protein